MIYAYRDTLVGTCGVALVNGFQTLRYRNAWNLPQSLNGAASRGGGSDWLCAGFVDTTECKEAYKILTKKHKLVYQTPVRRNRNSGNGFFFCLFDTIKEKKGRSCAVS